MKKTFLAIAMMSATLLSAKQPTVKQLQAEISERDAKIAMLTDSLNSIPDSTCVVFNDSLYCLPLKETQSFVEDVVDYFKNSTNDGLPSNWLGWVTLLLGLVTGVEGTRRIAAGKKLYATLKPLVQSRLGLAILSSATLSSLIVFMVNQFHSFSWNLFLVIWPWLALAASFVYEKFFKKDVQAQG